MTERELVAVHESAHAVIAELVGLPSQSVSVIRFASGPGRHHLAEPIGPHAIHRVIMWALAGAEAEKHLGDLPRARFADVDYEFARDLLACTCGPADPDGNVLGRQAETLAKALVVLHATWIRRVADRLLVDHILTAEQVHALRPAEDRP